MVTIGVLALQGDFAEHRALLEKLGVRALEIRLPEQLAEVDAVVLPGGESTTMGKLLDEFRLREPLQERIGHGLPVLATCAGMILLAREVHGPHGPLLGGMDITVERNAFGRQRESFEVDLDAPALGQDPLHAVFIRAPAIQQVGPGVEVLARLADGRIVAARQGNLIVAAFHPELADDTRLHELLLSLVRQAKEAAECAQTA